MRMAVCRLPPSLQEVNIHKTEILSQEYSITYCSDQTDVATFFEYQHSLLCLAVFKRLYFYINICTYYILLSHRKCQILSYVYIRDLNKQEAHKIQPSFFRSFSLLLCDSFIQ